MPSWKAGPAPIQVVIPGENERPKTESRVSIEAEQDTHHRDGKQNNNQSDTGFGRKKRTAELLHGGDEEIHRPVGDGKPVDAVVGGHRRAARSDIVKKSCRTDVCYPCPPKARSG